MLSFPLILLAFLWLHPIHISVMNIEFDQRAQSLEITQKVFIDDLEDVLEERHQLRLRLGTPNEHPRADELIEAYFHEHVWLKDENGRRMKGMFLGKESDLESVWIYVEVTQVTQLEELTVQNTLLMDWFTDQSNIVRFKYGDRMPTLRLTPARKRGVFALAP